MFQLTSEQVGRISAAASIDDARRVVGEISGNSHQSHFVRIEYIKAILGTRSVGGYFHPTIGAVQAKFKRAWNEARAQAAE